MLAALGEPEIKVRLAVRLLKNWYKYKENFGVFPTLYEGTLLKYFEPKYLSFDKVEEVDFVFLKNKLIDENIKESAKEFLPVEIRSGHREFLKKHLFSWCDLRNWHAIRYFTHTTKGTNERLFPVCGCGADNTPDHGANHCSQILKDRNKIVSKFDNLFRKAGLPTRSSLYDYLHSVYFSIKEVKDKKCMTNLIELMKGTIVRLIINDKSSNGRFLKAQVDATHQPNIDAAIRAINAADKKSEIGDIHKDKISSDDENYE